VSAVWTVEPYLHVGGDQVYNPLTDRTLRAGEPGFAELRNLADPPPRPVPLPPEMRRQLIDGGWLVESGGDLSRRFRLKYVSLEGHTVCNQACYFCPVSVAPRAPHAMPMDLYERIAGELVGFRDTLEAVFMINYNEPTADPRFLDQVRILKRHELPVAVLTNGWGLTPARVDTILEMGGLRYLSVNLSTLDRERYKRDRGADHLGVVLRNLDHVKQRRLAPQMDLVVLGRGDAEHQRDFEEIRAAFAGTCFEVKSFEVMDRAGYLPIGLKPDRPVERLRGCENVGSRPIQHIHITPHGTCVLCCEDYGERWVVGDLKESSVAEVLRGPEIARLRRFTYGVEEAPADFICRKCIFARSA
jgi:MoaA/NifB/PqqE/SkfB family radical SAM enzyme